MRAERVLRSVVNVFIGSSSGSGRPYRSPPAKRRGGQNDSQDNVDDFIEQFTLAQGELLKGNPEPAKKWYSPSTGRNPRQPIGPFVRGWEQVGAVIDHAASQLREGEMVDGETVTRHVTLSLHTL
jgi:hypothetical protein